MSDELRGSEPVMTAKEAIMEVRADVKALVEFMSAQKSAELPARTTANEVAIQGIRADMRSQRAWVMGAIAAGGGIGGGVAFLLQVLSVAARGATGQ